MVMTKENEDLEFQESEGFVPENMLMDELLPEYTPELAVGFSGGKKPETEPTESAAQDGTERSEPEGEVDETPVVAPEKIPELEELRERLKRTEEERKKAEARAGYYQRQAEKKAEPKVPPVEDVKPDVSDIVIPQEENFDTERDFLIALADYRADVKIREWEARSTAKTAAHTEQQQHDDFKRRLVADGPGMFEDFSESINDPSLPITDGILHILRETEVPVEITYYLAKNVKDCAAISRMTPVAAARAIGKIEAKIVADKEHLKESGSEHPVVDDKPKTKPISAAPIPITPIRSQSAPVTKDPSKMTNDEYRQYRRAGGR